MTVQIYDRKKMVTIWLTHADQAHAGIQEAVRRISREYKSKKYLVGVFLSGQGDLVEQTSVLLCHNQKALGAE